MLSTVHAAELQFRYDAEVRERELAILGAIRNRRESLAARAPMPATTRQAVTWPRPIGVKLDLATRAAPACA